MQFIIYNIVGFLWFNLDLLPFDAPFWFPSLGREKPPCFSVWSSLSALELRFSIVSSSSLESPTSTPEEEWIGWILLTYCYPALLIWTFVGWGWQGITKQLLSDKLDWSNHKQDAKKEPLGHIAPLLWTSCLLGGKYRALSSTNFLSTTWVRSIIPKVWGCPDLVVVVGGERSVTHFMVIDLLEIHHHGNRNLGKEF